MQIEKPQELKARRLLVFDDSADNRTLVRLFLGKENVEVVEFENGAITTEKLTEYAPEALLIDWIMPGVSGADLVEQIANEKPELLNRCILITGMSEDPSVRQWKQRGCIILPKPFTRQMLVNTVEQVQGL